MTGLNKTVRRKVTTGHRALVVILHPGAEPRIEVREKRKRKGLSITVEGLYYMLAMRAASVASKRGRRGSGRSK